MRFSLGLYGRVIFANHLAPTGSLAADKHSKGSMNGALVRGDEPSCARISLRVVGGKFGSNLTVGLAASRYPVAAD